MDDETRQRIEALVAQAHADLTRIIESCETPEAAEIMTTKAIQAMQAIRADADKLLGD